MLNRPDATVPEALDPVDGARALVRSDRRYFRLGAEVARCAGATVCRMRQCASTAAGWVAWFESPAPGRAPARERVAALTARAIENGSPRCRVYDYSQCSHLADALAAAGFRAGTEVGLVADRPASRNTPLIALRPVRSARDWADKLAVHASDVHGPDGHTVAAEEWLHMERRKAACGLELLLAECDGRVCGTVGMLAEGRLLRMKNLVVHEAMRGHGVGAAITAHMVRLARGRGFAALGLLALDDSTALEMYRRAGFAEVARVVEWVKWTA